MNRNNYLRTSLKKYKQTEEKVIGFREEIYVSRKGIVSQRQILEKDKEKKKKRIKITDSYWNDMTENDWTERKGGGMAQSAFILLLPRYSRSRYLFANNEHRSVCNFQLTPDSFQEAILTWVSHASFTNMNGQSNREKYTRSRFSAVFFLFLFFFTFPIPTSKKILIAMPISTY